MVENFYPHLFRDKSLVMRTVASSMLIGLVKRCAQLMNASADYVVNDVIVSLEDKTLCKLPQGGLINEKYHNWSVNDVYKDLKKEQEEGGEPDTDTLDEHGFGEGEGQQLTPEQERELSTKIDQALREGGG
jgi:hypothetical protein